MSAGERMELRRIAAELKSLMAAKKPGRRERCVIRLAKELEAMS